MTWVRDFLGSQAGRWTAVAFTAAAVGALGWVLYTSLGDSEAAASSRDRVFICAETGKSFEHEISPGEVIPIKSPHSGENTGYLAELCYWTADGRVKDEATAVLLNIYADKPGPTFCPDCGRLVVGHNPRPEPGATPPPLQTEYKPSKKDFQDER